MGSREKFVPDNLIRYISNLEDELSGDELSGGPFVGGRIDVVPFKQKVCSIVEVPTYIVIGVVVGKSFKLSR